MNEKQIKQFFHSVKHTALFSKLNDDEIKSLLQISNIIHLEAGETLFNQGEHSKNAYIVAEGKLAAITLLSSGEEKLIGHIFPHQIVGEMSFLSDQPRTLTIKANTHSTLLLIEHKDFEKYCEKNPEIIFKLSSLIVKRAEKIINLYSRQKTHQYIALVPANRSINLQNFISSLENTLIPNDQLVLIKEDKNRFEKREILQLLSSLHEKSDFVLYPIDLNDQEMAKKLIQFADKIVVVGNGNQEETISEFTINLLNQAGLIDRKNRELVLLYEKPHEKAQNTKAWLKQTQFHRFYHIHKDKEKDLRRFIRFMTGKACGLVLGAGGFESMIHIGALKALIEKHITIDAICGASGGALIGASYLLDETYESLHEKAIKLTKYTLKSTSPSQLTLPMFSLYNGKHNTEAIKEVFQDKQLEDLPLPLLCVTANLNLKKESIHTQGELWKLLRATTSIPALFPPILDEGQILLDGGVANELPVNVMSDFLDNQGTIIAVSLYKTKLSKYSDNDFPPYIPFWDALLMKLGLKKFHAPPFIDTFLDSMHCGGTVKSMENANLADLLIEPELPTNLDKKNPDHWEKLIELGYETTIKLLRES